MKNPSMKELLRRFIKEWKAEGKTEFDVIDFIWWCDSNHYAVRSCALHEALKALEKDGRIR